MKLLILNGPASPRVPRSLVYRGTYRANPTYFEGLPKDHEANVLFTWFLNEGGELGVVRNLGEALRLAELSNQLRPGESLFEVIEVTEPDEPSHSGGVFLGYDLSAGFNYSLLSWGLRPVTRAGSVEDPIRELLGLLNRHYAPQLNSQGLFDAAETASLCLKAMCALQDLSPNLFEGGDLRQFRVVGLYLVGRDQ